MVHQHSRASDPCGCGEAGVREGELEGGGSQGGRLAGLASVGGGGVGHRAPCCAGGGGGCGEAKQQQQQQQVMTVAEEKELKAAKEPVEEKEEQGQEMDVAELMKQRTELVDSMLEEGLLDEQFSQLQQLQDENTPDFVEEVVALFFEDSQRILGELTESLSADPIDYKVVDGRVHQFKGSSSSIGAQRVKQVCITFRQCCDKEDKEGCLEALEKVKEEFALVQTRLEAMLELEKQIVAAGGSLLYVEDDDC